MKKSNTEGGIIILWQDKSSLNSSLAAYTQVSEQLFLVMNEIQGMGVTPNQSILDDLLDKGDLIRKKLNRQLEKEIADILPFRKERARAEFVELLKRVDQILLKVDQKILCRNQPEHVYIEPSLLTWNPGGIVVDRQAIIDQYSVYLDSPEKQKVKDMAEELIKRVAEFNSHVDTVSHGKLKGLGYVMKQGEPVLVFDIDESLSIDGEAFRHVYSENKEII
jgi:hypothetical protein